MVRGFIIAFHSGTNTARIIHPFMPRVRSYTPAPRPFRLICSKGISSLPKGSTFPRSLGKTDGRGDRDTPRDPSLSINPSLSQSSTPLRPACTFVPTSTWKRRTRTSPTLFHSFFFRPTTQISLRLYLCLTKSYKSISRPHSTTTMPRRRRGNHFGRSPSLFPWTRALGAVASPGQLEKYIPSAAPDCP